MNAPATIDDKETAIAVRTALDHRCDWIGATAGDFDSVVQHAQRSERRFRRNRHFTAAVLVALIVLGLTGVVATNRLRPASSVVVADAPELRLIPDYLPNNQALSWAPFPNSLESWSKVWGDGKVTLTVLKDVHIETSTLDGLAQQGDQGWQSRLVKTESETNRQMTWKVGGWLVLLVMPADISWSQRLAFARSIAVDEATGTPTTPTAPLNLPLTGSSHQLAEVSDGWSLVSRQGVAISARPLRETEPRRANSVTTNVRGTTGELAFLATPGSTSIDVATLTWVEQSWSVSVSINRPGAENELRAEVMKMSESLRPATDDEWRYLRQGKGVSTAYVPTMTVSSEPTASGELVGRSWSISVAEGGTPDGCVNTVINLDGELKPCVPLTDSPVLWSGIRRVGDREVLVAFVTAEVEALSVQGSVDSSQQRLPEGTTVLTADSARFVGWVVVEVKPGVEVSIEAFRSIAAEDGTSATPFDQPDLESMGTFGVKR
jgi:hypothetical protein